MAAPAVDADTGGGVVPGLETGPAGPGGVAEQGGASDDRPGEGVAAPAGAPDPHRPARLDVVRAHLDHGAPAGPDEERRPPQQPPGSPPMPTLPSASSTVPQRPSPAAGGRGRGAAPALRAPSPRRARPARGRRRARARRAARARRSAGRGRTRGRAWGRRSGRASARRRRPRRPSSGRPAGGSGRRRRRRARATRVRRGLRPQGPRRTRPAARPTPTARAAALPHGARGGDSGGTADSRRAAARSAAIGRRRLGDRERHTGSGGDGGCETRLR